MLSPAQREAHYTGIGSSTAAAVLGLDPYRSPYQAWRELVDPTSRPDLSGNVRVQLGNLFEPAICNAAAARWELVTEEPSPNFTYRHPREPWALCHPDRLVISVGGNIRAAIEAKFRGSAMRRRYQENDGAPLDPELVQCHWQMLVGGFERIYLAVILGNEEQRHWKIERSEAECDYLLNAVGEWWHRHVLTLRPPPVETAEDARAKWPHSERGKRVAIDSDIANTIGQYSALCAYQRELADVHDKLFAHIVDAAGDAEELTFDGRVVATYREQKRSTIDIERLRAEAPMLAQQYTRVTSTRRLLPK